MKLINLILVAWVLSATTPQLQCIDSATLNFNYSFLARGIWFHKQLNLNLNNSVYNKKVYSSLLEQQPLDVLPRSSYEPPPPGVPQSNPQTTVNAPPAVSPVTQTEPITIIPKGDTLPTYISDLEPVLNDSSILFIFALCYTVSAVPLFLFLLLKGNNAAYIKYEILASCGYYSTIIPAVWATSVSGYIIITIAVILWFVVGFIFWKLSSKFRTLGYLIAISVFTGGFFVILIGSFFCRSPYYSGIAFLLFATKFVGTTPHSLSTIHSICIAISSIIVFFSLKTLIRKETKCDTEESIRKQKNSSTWSNFASCLVCSHGIAAGVSIILYRLHLCQYSPLDLIGMFALPTAFRLNSTGTYINSIFWILIFITGYYYRLRQNIARDVQDAQLIGGTGEELWRLKTEGKTVDDISIGESILSSS